jgi:hypothetical protein
MTPRAERAFGTTQRVRAAEALLLSALAEYENGLLTRRGYTLQPRGTLRDRADGAATLRLSWVCVRGENRLVVRGAFLVDAA